MLRLFLNDSKRNKKVVTKYFLVLSVHKFAQWIMKQRKPETHRVIFVEHKLK